MKTRVWKIYGAEGHRQKESFNESYEYDFTRGDNVRVIAVENSDKTGTNEYSIIRITRNDDEECWNELMGQLMDGIFENSKCGKIEEIEVDEIKIDEVVNDIIATVGSWTESKQKEFVMHADSYVNDFVSDKYLTAKEINEIEEEAIEFFKED